MVWEVDETGQYLSLQTIHESLAQLIRRERVDKSPSALLRTSPMRIPRRYCAAHAPPLIWPEEVARLKVAFRQSLPHGRASDTLPAVLDADN
ncbi:hypothetical protein V8E53_005096 [Lactarius tabidus]